MSPASIVLRIIILVVVFCVLIAVFAFAMKLIFLLVSLLGIILCALAVFFIFQKLFSPAKEEVESVRQREGKLSSQEGLVPLFREEPGVHQLVDKSKENLPKNVINIPADAEVSVLQESDIALRIKVTSGEHRGRIGWVDKSHVTGYSKMD